MQKNEARTSQSFGCRSSHQALPDETLAPPGVVMRLRDPSPIAAACPRTLHAHYRTPSAVRGLVQPHCGNAPAAALTAGGAEARRVQLVDSAAARSAYFDAAALAGHLLLHSARGPCRHEPRLCTRLTLLPQQRQPYLATPQLWDGWSQPVDGQQLDNSTQEVAPLSSALLSRPVTST